MPFFRYLPFLAFIHFALAAGPVDLIADTDFAEGFGAAFIYGKEYTEGRRPPRGKVTAYRDIFPWQVHLIPDGPVSKVGVKTHPWDFQEGLHHNYTDRNGKKVRELHAHRLVVNHQIEVNTPERLQFVQYNNAGLPIGHPGRNKKLVKRVTTDRKGSLTVFYNSRNEIRNAATAHSAKWARDTWPHMLVNQRFLKPIALADYEKLDFGITFRVDRMDCLSNWPNMIRGAARSGMNLKFMFFMGNNQKPEEKLFVGMMLYTSREKAWVPHLGVEQHGNIFYRDSVAPDGKNIPKLGETRSIKRDLKSLITKALKEAQSKRPGISTNPDDFTIYNFSFGFEGMGHWASEGTVSNLSLKGHPTTSPAGPKIECDASMLQRARERLQSRTQPFHTYWTLARQDAQKALTATASPYTGEDSLAYHQQTQNDGINARLLAYWWQLEHNKAAGTKALDLLSQWASTDPHPGTTFSEKIRYPNSGMDVARSTLPFVVAYDLLRNHPDLTEERRAKIEHWFRALSKVVREGVQRWESNRDFGNQHFQNHHVAHLLGLAMFGVVLNDQDLIQFALDSPNNPKDFKEVLAGLILMPGDSPHGGLRGKPLHPGELQDRYRTNSSTGLTYCHLSLTLMIYTAEILTRATGEDLLNWKAPGGEHLQLSAAFYSDFFRLRNAHLHGDYYFRDTPNIQNTGPFHGTFEVALHHWPDTPNLKAIVRSFDRAKTPRSWLSYYGLPILTHGVAKP